jgi:hypothetical protein
MRPAAEWVSQNCPDNTRKFAAGNWYDRPEAVRKIAKQHREVLRRLEIGFWVPQRFLLNGGRECGGTETLGLSRPSLKGHQKN